MRGPGESWREGKENKESQTNKLRVGSEDIFRQKRERKVTAVRDGGGALKKGMCLRAKSIQLCPTWCDPWRRKWQPTPVLLPGKSHGQRRLVSYSPWGPKESDTT